MSEFVVPAAATPIPLRWLPCGVKGAAQAPQAQSADMERWSEETLRGRKLEKRVFKFPGRVVGVGSFEEISVYNHDDAVLDSDAVPQSLAFMDLLNRFGRS